MRSRSLVWGVCALWIALASDHVAPQTHNDHDHEAMATTAPPTDTASSAIAVESSTPPSTAPTTTTAPEHDHAHGAEAANHDDHDHNHDHADHSTNATDVSSSIWKHSALWNLTVVDYQRAISLCATDRTVKSMMFALLPMNKDMDTVVRVANTMVDTFDSSKVTRRAVSKGTTVLVQADHAHLAEERDDHIDHVLYQVRFKSVDGSTESRCVDAILNVTDTGAFVLFTEHARSQATVTITDSKQRVVPFTTCFTGCEATSSVDGGSSTTAETTTGTSSSHKSQNWSGPILASVAIALTSLLGVLLLSLGKKHMESVVDYMMSFAAGCLLGVTVFHLYPEGASYVSDMGEWVAGTCVLGGIAFSMGFEQLLHQWLASFGVDACGGHKNHDGAASILGIDDHKHHDRAHRHHNDDAMAVLESYRASRSSQHVSVMMASLRSTPVVGLAHSHAHGTHTPTHNLEEGGDPRTFRAKYISSLRFVQPIAWITAMGDFFHAFTDGVVLAVAFKSCSSSLGWAVALGVVMHEVPHRVGDLFIFLKAGMLVSQALVVNFIASLASLLAVLIVLAAGDVSTHTLGIMLSVGAGALLFIAMVKLLPPMLEVREPRRAWIHFVVFSLGCVAIGLSMLQHAHCEVGEGGHGEEGHEGHAH